MRYLCCSLLLLAVACTDSSSTTAHVTATGTLGTTPVTLKSAAATIEHKNNNTLLVIYLSPFADACSATSITSPDHTAVELALYQAGPGGTIVAATTPGVYSTSAIGGPGPWAEIDTYDRDASCAPGAGDGKGDGTITLTQADATSYAGTFDFTTDEGQGHAQGTFATSDCAWSEPTTACQ
jgi:hypothetical protein